MQHLTEEQLVSHYYHDDEPQSIAAHLRDCTDCTAQYETIRRVLALVTEAPVPERGDDYGTQVWNRLRWKLGSDRRRTTWVSSLAAAAALALAFFAGLFWSAHHQTTTSPGTATLQPVQAAANPQSSDHADKVLLLVVSDHLDSTERVLLEVANADPQKSLDIGQESRRAGELVAANRIYRQTASQRGNEQIASLLGELEPVLIQISHSGSSLGSDELTALQKRIEARGLVFKVRVISAQTTAGEKAPRNINTDTL